MKNSVLRRNQTQRRQPRAQPPPKNSVTISAEISVMPRYSPTKNMPNFIPEYSVW